MHITVLPKKPQAFFIDIIKTTIKEREQRKIVRPDIMNILLEARESNDNLNIANKTLSDNEIYAQCMIFYSAGFETVSSALALIMYELSLNTEIQDKLRKEIDEVWEECNGELSYEEVTKMKYLDMVVSGKCSF